MNDHDSIDCERFDAHADELALGQLDEPLRGQMLAHAGGCPHCHSLLDGLGTVADRLLLAAPQVEPPAGFESRALERLGTRSARRPRRLTPATAAAAAVAVVALFVGAFVVTRGDDERVVAAAIVGGNGTEVGAAQLVPEPVPHVLVTIAAPGSAPGIRTCELQRRDGAWESVGWWDAADIASGVWAVGIDPGLLDARAMRILADGDVIATAAFD